jgi:hypothetical protein
MHLVAPLRLLRSILPKCFGLKVEYFSFEKFCFVFVDCKHEKQTLVGNKGTEFGAVRQRWNGREYGLE